MRGRWAWGVLVVALGGSACASASSSSPAPTAVSQDAFRRWRVLGESICSETHDAVSYDDETVEVSLPREAFFDAGSKALLPASDAAVALVAQALADLGEPRVLVRSNLEDAVADRGTKEERLVFSRRRADAIADALVAHGVPRERIVRVGTSEGWEGSFDGPAQLDPAEGRIDFVVLGPGDAPLRCAGCARGASNGSPGPPSLDSR